MKKSLLSLIVLSVLNYNISASDDGIGLIVGYETSNGSGTRTTEYSQARGSGYYTYTYQKNYDSDISEKLGLFRIGYISDATKKSFYSLSLKVGNSKEKLSYSNGYKYEMKNINVFGLEYIGYLKINNDNSGLGFKVEIDSYNYKLDTADKEYLGQSDWKAYSFVWGINYFYKYNFLLASIGLDYRRTLWEVTSGVDDYTVYSDEDNLLLGVISISYIF